jgi:hypothetical protein
VSGRVPVRAGVEAEVKENGAGGLLALEHAVDRQILGVRGQADDDGPE